MLLSKQVRTFIIFFTCTPFFSGGVPRFAWNASLDSLPHQIVKSVQSKVELASEGTEDGPDADEYPEYTLNTIRRTNTKGILDSLNKKCQIRGFAYGVNLNPSGLLFSLIDRDSNGIWIINTQNNSKYAVTEGDNLIIRGEIQQWNGLAFLHPDTIILVSSNNALIQPQTVRNLGEATEGKLVKLTGCRLLDPKQWTKGKGDLGFSVDVKSGSDIFSVFINRYCDLFYEDPPFGLFNIIGLGSQNDSMVPYLDNYTLVPRYANDIQVYKKYSPLSIGEVSGTNSLGIADSIRVNCRLTGIVGTQNMSNTKNGLRFWIMDDNGAGINIYSQTQDFNYVPTPGEIVECWGTINQNAGLIQLNIDTILFIQSNGKIPAPFPVDNLDEGTESKLVTLRKPVRLVSPSQWNRQTDGFLVDVTDGIQTYQMWVDKNTPLYQMPNPLFRTFLVTGIGSQSDPTLPYLDNYRIIPRFLEDIEFLNNVDNFNSDGAFRCFPQPVRSSLSIEVNDKVERVQLFDNRGNLVFDLANPERLYDLPVEHLTAGSYFLLVWGTNALRTKQIIKQ